MIIHLLPHLAKRRIVLASASPRRREILDLLGLKYEVIVSNHPELLDKQAYETPAAYVKENAYLKAADVAKRLSEGGCSADLVIGADTVVVLDEKILEKPKSEGEAYRMLSSLSGRCHKVITAVAFVTEDMKGNRSLESVELFHEETTVQFAELKDDAIWAYIKSGEPMDKAGSYGIQGMGGSFISKIEGCYFTVMGLPMHRAASFLERICEEQWKVTA